MERPHGESNKSHEGEVTSLHKSSPCEGLVPSSSASSMVNGGSQLAVDVSGRRVSSAGSPLAPGSPHLPPGKAEGPHSPASAEYWLSRNPLADHIFITDVTVNLQTVTIRECKTQDGFFKNRPMNELMRETNNENWIFLNVWEIILVFRDMGNHNYKYYIVSIRKCIVSHHHHVCKTQAAEKKINVLLHFYIF